jgi:NADH-quinone oxidoreductase subunit K
MSIEIALVGLSINFITVSMFYYNSIGQLFALLILIVAAAESAIGLALIIIWHRISNNLKIAKINQIKG